MADRRTLIEDTVSDLVGSFLYYLRAGLKEPPHGS